MNLTDFWQISDTIWTDFWQIFINQFSDRFLTDIWQIYVNLGTYIDQEYPPFRWIPWMSFTLRPPTSTSLRSSCRRYLKTAKVEVLWFRDPCFQFLPIPDSGFSYSEKLYCKRMRRRGNWRHDKGVSGIFIHKTPFTSENSHFTLETDETCKRKCH